MAAERNPSRLRVRPGLYGTSPSLTDLRGGDIIHHVDFPSVYASLLQNWLRVPVEPILHRELPTIGFVWPDAVHSSGIGILPMRCFSRHAQDAHATNCYKVFRLASIPARQSRKFRVSCAIVMRTPLLLFAAILLAAPSCANKKDLAAPPKPAAATGPNLLQQGLAKIASLFPKKATPPAALPPQWTGVIRMVNLPERFVLIESAAVGTAIPGETYLAISKGAETASLRMTSLKNPPFLIADILTGSPSAGEKIYRPKADQPEPAPPPVPKTEKAKKTPGAEG